MIKVFEGHWHFVFTFLVEDYFESPRVVINLEKSPHRLFLLAYDSSDDDNL
jgi:hypothetical protein